MYLDRDRSQPMPKPPKARKTKPLKARIPLEVGPLNDFVGYRLRRAQLAVYDDFVRGQGGSALTPGLFGVLVLIDHNPDITQQQLCEGIGVDKSTLVVTLHRLSDRGLIKRVRSTQDRRQNGLRLTAKGAARLRAMIAYVKQHERKITARLTDAESKHLVELLIKVTTGFGAH
jgi:DNA-binding MarR family transcriptional regulator